MKKILILNVSFRKYALEKFILFYYQQNYATFIEHIDQYLYRCSSIKAAFYIKRISLV